ncbi:MAG: TIGR04283 family arsenosugar biosynthesis glycosyltransferase [Candidatus Omnitrophica bacterium]|nr:TIGR04283 family arsenosugar biosynthesis glycosyltransferase [Candidatus Omnitrophota bacterium]
MISVIIPVLNEERAIERTLVSLPYGDAIEVIVIDSQSHDRTLEIVHKFPVKTMISPRGRALQMNAGAAAAKGNIFLFLHADCVIDTKGLQAVEKQVSLNHVGGCFTHKIDSNKWLYRCIEMSGTLRAKLFKIFYGDQAIFVRRDIFEQIGGFQAVSLFEDVIFSKKLRRLGRTIVLQNSAIVLPRRWEHGGVLKTMLLNWFLTFCFFVGISPKYLGQLYRNIR